MLNNGPNEYEGIDENSTDDEKLNTAIEILSKNFSYEYLDYEKLCVPYDKEGLFDAKILRTEFVDIRGMRDNDSHPVFILTHNGRLILEKYGSYLEYLKSQQESIKEQQRKDDEKQKQVDEKYKLETQNLKNITSDYSKIKMQRNILFIISIISIILALVNYIKK